MRWELQLLGRRGRKAAALTLTLSLLNQQGLLVSQALGQVVAGRVTAAPLHAPVVPVVPAAPALSAPTLSPLSVSPLSLTPSLTAPSVSLPLPAGAKAAAAAVGPQVAAAATPALPASVGVKAAAAPVLPAPVVAGLAGTVTREPQGRSSGNAGALRELGRTLAKGRVKPAASLALAFDGARRGAGNGVAEPVSGRSPTAARPGLEPAPAAETAPAQGIAAAVPEPGVRRSFIEFNIQYLKDMKKLFAESATKPNKQDYMFLVTKTFGLNLAIRAAFAIQGVQSGELPLLRAVLSTAWYQVQDAVFTVFGQTYMKFLGKMTGMLRIGSAKVGDLLFVYTQLVGFEFLNRLVLGPIGENPLVYTWGGIGLLFLNNLQGMISGGLLIPVINKLRAAGYIGERTSNYLYQAASLTMHLGLLATFGYQTLFTILTTALMVLSWSAYIGLSFFAKPKPGSEPKP